MKNVSGPFYILLLIMLILLVLAIGGSLYYFSQASAGVSTVGDQLSTLSSHVSNLENQLSVAAAGLSSVQDQLSSMQTQLASGNSQVSALQADISSYRAQATSLQTELSASNAQVSALQNDLSSYRSQVSAMQNQLSSSDSQVSAVQAGLSSSQSQVSTLRASLSSVESRLSALQGQSNTSSLPSFASIVSSVQPSVVSINTRTNFSNRFIQGAVQGAGSGWIYDPSGIVVTCNHVVAGASSITVQLNDGRSYTPVYVRGDSATDIAILKINAGTLPALKIADVSKARVGDWVLAIGDPLGTGISSKNGILSRLGVNVTLSATESYSNLIETNVAINAGNSGGPLVNLSGEVIGVTSLKVAAVGVEGMGFAINIADAIPVIQRLLR